MNKEQALINAIDYAKNSQFKLTAIKVEMEIVFHRNNAPRPELGCAKCHDGRIVCTRCAGSGCGRCNHNGIIMCRRCYAKTTNFDDLNSVQDAILKPLVKLGLAEKIPAGQLDNFSYVYRPCGALAFAKTYNDVTVDTEMTFTLSVADPRDALKLPEVLKAFYTLKDKIGQEPSVETAGMHISFLNSANCSYPTQTSSADLKHFRNFQKSMILLMPALYFLGSCNERSRGLGYRRPMVEQQHYAAINYSGGALEFRLFETCYDTPEAILDNIVVMSNCLRFWTTKYTRNHLQKITKEVTFGINHGQELKRFYRTVQHIDLLNRGLRIIKPSYYTITELKKQRNFTVNKQSIKQEHKLAIVEAEKQYKEYEKKFGWETVMRQNNYINEYLESKVIFSGGVARPEVGDSQILAEAGKYGKDKADEYQKRKEPKDKFCEKAVVKLTSPGEYRLAVA